MDSELELTLGVLTRAKCPEDVFGELAGTQAEQRRTITASYRLIVREVHPDRFASASPQVRAKAEDAFRRLTAWKEAAEAKLAAGTYGNVTVPTPAPADAFHPQVVKAAGKTYTLTERLGSGDLADLYACTYQQDGKEHQGVFKLAQSSRDNDLLETESRVLLAMYPPTQPKEKFYRFLPRRVDGFLLKSPSGSHRRVNVLERAKGYFSLEDVMKTHPKGLDFRDVVWMLKRAWMALGFVHLEKDVVHGAVLPPHLLVHPSRHGAKLVDWCYAVQGWKAGTGRVKALSVPWRAYYAPEVLGKSPVSPATDLYMLAKCAVALLGGSVATNEMPPTVPKPIQAFLGASLLAAPRKRPNDAWQLHEEFDELLERIVGKPTYRPLSMPGGT